MKINRYFLFFILLPLLASAQALYEPIAVYLTWQHSPSTTMSIQWITFDDNKDNNIEYHADGDLFWKRLEGVHTAMPGIHQFLIHRVELEGLHPYTDYHFRTGDTGKIYTFRTMPSDLSVPIRFVVGGDVYHDNIATVIATNQQAARSSPMFALVGGDLAYAADRFGVLPDDWQSWIDWALAGIESRPEKRLRWVEWLAAWKDTMVTPEGRLIPIVPAIGNHDVNGGFGKTPEDAIFFHTFFSFPGSRGYNVLDFDDYLSIMVLNTGHTASIGGQQTRWLQQTLRDRQQVPHLFALYHVGAYPSVRKFNGKVASSVRRFWVPIFDQYGVAAAFEHHDHAYKRTHPLKGNVIDPNGVIYLGDGAWGPEKTRTPQSPENLWYLAKTAAKRHFILVTLNKSKRNFIAIDPEGVIFDQTSSTSAEASVSASAEGSVSSRVSANVSANVSATGAKAK